MSRSDPSQAQADPPIRSELLAGLGTAVAAALLGAPVGLLWAALAPHAVVRITAGSASVLDPLGRAFVSADLWFVGLALVAGVLTGLLAALALRRYGPGPVLGLAVGGLLAGEIARRTGHLVGLDTARALVRSGADGQAAVAVRLRSWQGVLAWPVGALATFLVGLLARRPPAQPGREAAGPQRVVEAGAGAHAEPQAAATQGGDPWAPPSPARPKIAGSLGAVPVPPGQER